MSELREKILQVKDQKDTYIIPENIRKDVTILGVTGTLEEGVDTSDATATTDDIVRNKTAYVDGSKITGTRDRVESSSIGSPSYFNFRSSSISDQNQCLGITDASINSCYVNSGDEVETFIPYSNLATALGLASNKIKAGEQIIGISGKSSIVDTEDSNATANDLVRSKTAYVNGQKITGTVYEMPSGSTFGLTTASGLEEAILTSYGVTDKLGARVFTKPTNNDTLIRSGDKLWQGYEVPYEDIATINHVTSDKIKSGETVLGISGDQNVIDTSISSTIIEPEYSSTGTSPFVLDSETGYYEISGPCSGLLEISFTNSITTDVTLNYKGTKLSSDASYTDIELDGELVESLSSTTDYEDVVIENVTPGDHTITVKITSEYNTTNLSIKMLSINISENPITANTVLKDYVGFVNGSKVTGTYVPLDTSDATATSADIATGKTAYVNGQKITGIGAMTFATVAEMNAVTNVPEDTLAIVYGTDYVGTYRFDNGSWTEIGSKSVEQQSMDNLNALDGSTDQYEGLGGTEEQVNEVLDEIIEGSQEEEEVHHGPIH